MDTADYTTAWLFYLVAAAVLSVLSWRVFRRFLPRPLAYLLQCWLLALLLTPYYVEEGSEIMAPALMVFAMDSITIAPVAGVRALIPLIMALFGMLLVAIALSVIHHLRHRRDPPPTRPVPYERIEPH